ncbi:hypothetical protein FDP22_04760 [Paroceanicella profunda]|uniref:Nitrogen fixation protein n=1 Tax=Paroceanicella profunda TaxID=2579971 RepID=A0A5B8FGF5_9RHOB|nr:hypothetical protein [Paroceanicella profunda]QDL91151.1 hypothetical protein FDP22_04760 [Paroceanicella profunda]
MAAPDALLIGVVDETGHVGLLGRPLPVDAAFLAATRARSVHSPEARFRFAGGCVEGRCRQWTGRRCGLIARLVEDAAPAGAALRPCGIRADCRWFAEQGPSACAVCPEVVTDGGGPRPAGL